MRCSMMTVAVLGFTVFSQGTGFVSAGDWPQILGPNRNGIAENESISADWSKSGPSTLWQRSVGHGFSGVAVANGIVVLIHRVGNEERIEAMNARTGKVIWKAAFPTGYQPSIVPDDGPRSVPVIHKQRVYVYGVQGVLRCLDLKTGKQYWSRETHKDFKAQEGYFGAGSTPIVEGDKILVNVGGARMGAGIVAFALDTGKTIWKAVQDTASYSSPVAATIDGNRHVIFVTRLNAVSLNPKTGKVRFQFPFGGRGPTVNGASPLVLNGHLFLTASYGIGAVYSKLSKNAATELWKSDEIMSSQYTTCVENKGLLYGLHGRQDAGAVALRCIDPRNKKIRWTKKGFGYATLIRADDKLAILKTNGELVIVRADPKKYTELARAAVFSSTTRALPALSNGLLYARDEKTLKCIDLRPRK